MVSHLRHKHGIKVDTEKMGSGSAERKGTDVKMPGGTSAGSTKTGSNSEGKGKGLEPPPEDPHKS